MAETQHEDQTEQASARRLNQAREEGNIPLCRDLGTWAGLMAGMAALFALGPALRDSFLTLMWASADGLAQSNSARLLPFIWRPITITAAITAAVALGATIALGT